MKVVKLKRFTNKHFAKVIKGDLSDSESHLKNPAKRLVLKLPDKYAKPDLVDNISPTYCFQVATNTVFIRSFSFPGCKRPEYVTLFSLKRDHTCYVNVK